MRWEVSCTHARREILPDRHLHEFRAESELKLKVIICCNVDKG